jgi:uncharacterized protein (DUF433 family)
MDSRGQTADRLDDVIHGDPEVLGGTPVFVGTRVPVRTLFDYPIGGHAMSEFLDDFPSVTREHAAAVLQLAADLLIERARNSGKKPG